MTAVMIMMIIMVFGNHCDIAHMSVMLFLVIKADFRMCKISTFVTKSEDTVLCGNSIWQELVTEREDVWPLCRIFFLKKTVLCLQATKYT